jgi:NRAMP (natural resistance-associated macrophage protein)-like metal ion transporter
MRAMRLKRLFKSIGPGFITGAADDDPSGILTYAQTGAQFGYRQLWIVLFSLPFMIAIQEMCGRIGMVTGKGLAGVIRLHYGRTLLMGSVGLLFIANAVNIGADLGAMASSAQLLFGLPFLFWLAAIAITTLLLEVFIPYPTYSRYLKYLTLSLFAYVAVAFLVKQDWLAVVRSLITPSFSWDEAFLFNIVAIFGTTISPYLFFWQADEEVEEEVERGQLKEMGKGKPKITMADVSDMKIDTSVGMVFSNLVTFFIIVTAASTLPLAGITTIETAAQGAEALRPVAGSFASWLFALGIIGTGLLAVPVLAGSASYAIAESFGWKEGLSRTLRQAQGFYAVIALATLTGCLVNFIGVPPFRMLYYTAVLNGVIAPPLMVFILLIANSEKIMGKYRNHGVSNVLGWVIAVFMGLCGVALIAQVIFGA